MGCEILILRSACPGNAGPMCGARGHPVVVRRSGWRWGREELPEAGNFWLIEITDIEAQVLQPYLESAHANAQGEPLMLRLWKVLLDSFPPHILWELETYGRVAVSYEQIREYIVNQHTGVPMPLEPFHIGVHV